jgi:hypothetical protein
MKRGSNSLRALFSNICITGSGEKRTTHATEYFPIRHRGVLEIMTALGLFIFQHY